MRDRDSPVEWTGTAHLVSYSCDLCGESDTIPESQADYLSETDSPHVCSDCNEEIEDLWSDMYIRGQVRRTRVLADYMEANGFHVKSQMLRALAQDMEKYEPVIRAIERVRKNGKLTRERLEKQIQRYDEA